MVELAGCAKGIIQVFKIAFNSVIIYKYILLSIIIYYYTILYINIKSILEEVSVEKNQLKQKKHSKSFHKLKNHIHCQSDLVI